MTTLDQILTAIYARSKIPQLTINEAKDLGISQWWLQQQWRAHEIALIQLSQKRVCMDMEVFGNMLELAVGAPIVRSTIPKMTKEWLDFLRTKFRR